MVKVRDDQAWLDNEIYRRLWERSSVQPGEQTRSLSHGSPVELVLELA